MINLKYLVMITLGSVSLAWGSNDIRVPQEHLWLLLKAEIERKNPDAARIDLDSLQISNAAGENTQDVRVSILDENTVAAEVRFAGINSSGRTVLTGSARYKAWKAAAVAKQRILPGEKITPDSYSIENVLISQGMGREFRGVMISDEATLKSTESRQTILEGQFIVSTAVRRVPDIRKGEVVTIRLNSGEVILTATGIAEEASYLKGTIHVLTDRSKKLLTGTLADGHVVEVKL